MSKDFTPFLKYIPDASPGWLPPVGKGWHEIVHEILSEIDKLVANQIVLIFVVVQIKEKFGDLRVNYRVDPSVSDDVRKQISEIASRHTTRASSTCEICGEQGRIGSYFTGYYQALCRPHAIARIRSNTPIVPKDRTWNVQLTDDGLKITDINGELMTSSNLEQLELTLTNSLDRQGQLGAFRDARYMAGN
jgi:hypothetical protein